MRIGIGYDVQVGDVAGNRHVGSLEQRSGHSDADVC